MMVRKLKRNLCECGCKQACHNRFVNGHNRRGHKQSEKQKTIMRKMMLENNPAKRCEVREKMSKAHMGKKLSDEHKKKISDGVRGEKNGFYGKQHTPEVMKRIVSKLKGRKLTPEQRKIRKRKMACLKGENNPAKRPEVRKKIGLKSKGRFPSKKTRRLMSLSKIELFKNPENHPMWRGGCSNDEGYCDAWHDKEYKQDIKERDNYKCQNPDCWGRCGVLCVHHIDYNKLNCHPTNLITLCISCNSRANAKRRYWKRLYTDIIQRRAA